MIFVKKNKLTNDSYLAHLRKPLTFFLLSVCVLTVYIWFGVFQPKWSPFLLGTNRNPTSGARYIIDTPGCLIPNLEIRPASAAKYFNNKVSLNCIQNNAPDLTASKGNTLYFFPERLSFYLKQMRKSVKYLNEKAFIIKAKSSKAKQDSLSVGKFLKMISVRCCSRGIVRVEQSRNKYNNKCDKQWRLDKICRPITEYETTIPKFDAIVVECFAKKKFYTNVHHLVQKRTNSKMYNSTLQAKIPKETKFLSDLESLKPLNVIIFGTDSVSRYNFLRSNVKAYRYLMEELKALDFMGYNRVADNTYPNLVPTLSGLSAKELSSHKCFNNSEGAIVPAARKYDDCPFIWKDFKKRGYITTLFEDAPSIAIFNYLKTGFVKQPTDHYGRPSFIVSNELIGHNRLKVCQRNKLSLEVLHDYSLDILNTYSHKPTFSLLWSAALTHEDLTSASFADEPHVRYLRALKHSGVLDRSVLLFMSDHGLRFGKFRETLLGKFEENMPYLYVVVPDYFRERFPKLMHNLEKNTKALVTPFDLYSTLLDIANMNYMNISYVEEKPLQSTRNISLFQEIPTNRSCIDIGFDYKYCMCQEYIPMEGANYISPQIENYVRDYLNKMLQPYPKCSIVQKVYVTEVLIEKRDSEYFREVEENILTVQARYFPGDALIDVTLIWKKNKSHLFQVIGDIARINKYGNQSHCIEDNEFRKFCICHDTLQYTQIKE